MNIQSYIKFKWLFENICNFRQLHEYPNSHLNDYLEISGNYIKFKWIFRNICNFRKLHKYPKLHKT